MKKDLYESHKLKKNMKKRKTNWTGKRDRFRKMFAYHAVATVPCTFVFVL